MNAFSCFLLLILFSLSNETQAEFLTALQEELKTLNPDKEIGTLQCNYAIEESLFINCVDDAITDITLNKLKLTSIPSSISALENSLLTIRIVSGGLESVGDGFSSLKNLQLIALNCNELKAFPETLALDKLHWLDLGTNKFASIPNNISSYKTLNSLFLESNDLSTLPTDFSSLVLLKELGLKDNPSLKASTDIFSSMDELTQLNISNTLISGQKPEFMFESGCVSTCISSKECTRNDSCSCDAFGDEEFCAAPCLWEEEICFTPDDSSYTLSVSLCCLLVLVFFLF